MKDLQRNKWHRIENNVHNDFIFKSSEKNAVLVLINFYV